MSNKELKQQIIKYNLSWITTQLLYVNIDGISEKHHSTYPEPLQKIIVKNFCNWNLQDNNDSSFDFSIKNENIEMKSTTDVGGAVHFSEKQLNSNQIIWFYVDYEKYIFIIKKIKVDQAVKEKLLEKFQNKSSNAIKSIFEEKDNYSPKIQTIKFDMRTMKRCK